MDTRQDDFEHDLGGRITNLETAAHFDGTVAEVREELHDQGEVVQAVADVIFDRMSNLEAGARQISHRADLSSVWMYKTNGLRLVPPLGNACA